jgi:hypothetical protein
MRKVLLVVWMLVAGAAALWAQTWTAPRTWVSGELVTADLMNAHIRDNLSILRTGGIAVTAQAPGDMLYASSATQIARVPGGANRVLVTDASSVPSLAATLPNGFAIHAPALSGIVTNSGLYSSATAQPGFLAYNSASDAGQTGGITVEFDTEVYDEAGNFASNTFTAPATGRYLFCAGVQHTAADADVGASMQLVTSNRTYMLSRGRSTQTTPTTEMWNGCVIADMDAADTAHVVFVQSSGTYTISGSSSPVTYFSGRLMP